MTSRVVKCGVERSKGLVSTILDQNRLICSNCGTVVSDQYRTDTTAHLFYEFIGAFCPIDKMIHYRWIRTTWSVSEHPEIRPREEHEALILPKSTEVGAEKYFKKGYYWNSEDGNTCYDPGFTEVVWSDFDDSKFVLLRPTDTGYLKINTQGIHTPFIAALIEWLLKQDQWNELAELASKSVIHDREKKIIKKAVAQPTPSNIFKFLWTFKRYIPGWNSKRSLGKRSPSMLIQDEIRWTTNRLEDLDEVDRERLIRYGPEPQYWGVWPELWPKELELGSTLADFGPHLGKIGLDYDQSLRLIHDPDIKKNQRSWMEMADKMIQWPINIKKGGQIDKNLSQRGDRGFVDNLKNNLAVAIEKRVEPKGKWVEYLVLNLPLVWQKNGEALHFTADTTFIEKDDLQQTLKVLKPWVTDETNAEVKLEFENEIPSKLAYLVRSMKKRFEDTPVHIFQS